MTQTNEQGFLSHPHCNVRLRDSTRLGFLKEEVKGAARNRLYVFETYLSLFVR